MKTHITPEWVGAGYLSIFLRLGYEEQKYGRT